MYALLISIGLILGVYMFYSDIKSKKHEKCDARINNKKTVSFGQKGASDYVKHKDPQRKQII